MQLQHSTYQRPFSQAVILLQRGSYPLSCVVGQWSWMNWLRAAGLCGVTSLGGSLVERSAYKFGVRASMV